MTIPISYFEGIPPEYAPRQAGQLLHAPRGSCRVFNELINNTYGSWLKWGQLQTDFEKLFLKETPETSLLSKTIKI
jgi:hypothetical protein